LNWIAALGFELTLGFTSVRGSTGNGALSALPLQPAISGDRIVA